jgi:hypothetical protein
MRMKNTHSSDLSLEAFDNGSNGSDLVAKSSRRAPIDTVAPARVRAAERSNSGGEAQRSELVISGQIRRRKFRRTENGSFGDRRRKPSPRSPKN